MLGFGTDPHGDTHHNQIIGRFSMLLTGAMNYAIAFSLISFAFRNMRRPIDLPPQTDRQPTSDLLSDLSSQVLPLPIDDQGFMQYVNEQPREKGYRVTR